MFLGADGESGDKVHNKIAAAAKFQQHAAEWEHVNPEPHSKFDGLDIICQFQKRCQNKTQRTSKGAGGREHLQNVHKVSRQNTLRGRHFSTIFSHGKEHQKSSKTSKMIFDTSRQISHGTNFPAPFLGGSWVLKTFTGYPNVETHLMPSLIICLKSIEAQM